MRRSSRADKTGMHFTPPTKMTSNSSCHAWVEPMLGPLDELTFSRHKQVLSYMHTYVFIMCTYVCMYICVCT